MAAVLDARDALRSLDLATQDLTLAFAIWGWAPKLRIDEALMGVSDDVGGMGVSDGESWGSCPAPGFSRLRGFGGQQRRALRRD